MASHHFLVKFHHGGHDRCTQGCVRNVRRGISCSLDGSSCHSLVGCSLLLWQSGPPLLFWRHRSHTLLAAEELVVLGLVLHPLLMLEEEGSVFEMLVQPGGEMTWFDVVQCDWQQ